MRWEDSEAERKGKEEQRMEDKGLGERSPRTGERLLGRETPPLSSPFNSSPRPRPSKSGAGHPPPAAMFAELQACHGSEFRPGLWSSPPSASQHTPPFTTSTPPPAVEKHHSTTHE